MKIGIIGATGNAGSAIYKVAQQRGLDVTAIVRNAAKAREVLGADANVIEKNAFALTAGDLTKFDYVVNAFATPTAYQHIDLAAKLVRELRENKTTKIIFIIGASSLLKPDGTKLLDSLLQDENAANWIATPIEQAKELTFLKLIDNVEWLAVSPQANFVPGPAAEYQLGVDHLLFNAAGHSIVSTGTMAEALVDQIENPTVPVRTRFTVGDK
ncbi:NAD-dependent epimerase/dehydratase family protein [Periweissella cryptocerci]|uniref:NAD-dependent epimerase/dehydratase family protein n=1 Tax=Periweissella cryptocerci TaxID=2506420 RepID=A0A4P6YU43_9LACO|nr:NAD(P)H-binding protein [Periweissella cryptocerci]QBO36299.1 NAD-dependent epimerase/dehydratase family protein [Periweissella cryptocerci]